MAGPVEDNREQIVKEAVRRFIDARWQGQEPDVDEFVGQYPGLERQVKKGIRNAQRIDVLFDSLVRSNESDFEDAAAGHDLTGRKVGSFEIVEMIGRGGMGIVYLAHDTKLKRSVAIKTIPAQLDSDPTTRMRFRREAELLASLNHPNIAVIHDIIEEDKSCYLILEYVLGETLAERIAREPLALQEALSICQQIAEAVSAAHEKGLVHRDLKPGNIKITPDGRVKILDFGLAKAVPTEGKLAETNVTQPGRIIGTPAYMSPEQARGKDTDHRTDIWSFGCIMYQILTAHLPFEGRTATDTLARIIEREPDWEALPNDIPENIRTLLHRCLEKDPDQRLGDIAGAAMEMSAALNKPLATPVTALRKIAMLVSVAIIIVITAIAARFVPQQHAQSSSKEIRLVVLPFENLGPVEDGYFADGITDAITARLAGIPGLGVISRQSAMQYKKREKNISQIAEELRVDYILEGTVQRERPSDPASRVRIIPQLIKTSDDTHVWAHTYDNDMSKVFHLQSDLAEQVAQALDLTLREPARQVLMTKPTENMEAYDYYLRGKDYSHRSHSESNKRIAIRMYGKAVELDPTFALAYAQLSHDHRMMYWNYYDHSNARLALAKQAADRALELNPQLPEAHIALGAYFYHGHLDYDRALEQFAIARKSQPNNEDILSRIAYVQRRQGKFEQALTNLQRSYELDPLNHFIVTELGTTYVYLRKYQEAERYYVQAITLAPDVYSYYRSTAWIYLYAEGSTEKARTVLAEAMKSVKSEEHRYLTELLVNIDVFDGKYQKALDRLSLESQDIDNQEYIDERAYSIPNALPYARICEYMNKKELAKKYYEEARSILELKIQLHPEHAKFHSALGVAYAGLGRKGESIQEGKTAIEMLPTGKDAIRGPDRVEDLARIYVMVGEYDAAIDQIEYLFSMPGPLSIPLLRLDPAWSPLRDHPRFKKLIESDN